jgi:hypothetical protein
MTPLKRYLIILLFMIIGIGFGIGFGAVFYVIRKKKDDQITMGGSIKDVIIPSIFFWVTIGILIILKCSYGIHLQLFILSAIVLAGFLSAISSKKAWMFFLCFGVVVLQLGLEALIRRFVEWINCTSEKRKAKILAEAAEKAIGITANRAKVNPISPTYHENKELRHVPAPKKLNIDPSGNAPILNNIINSPPQIGQPSASAPPMNN